MYVCMLYVLSIFVLLRSPFKLRTVILYINYTRFNQYSSILIHYTLEWFLIVESKEYFCTLEMYFCTSAALVCT